LRTWERRYGIPSPDRSATGRRLYSEDDLQVIRRMTALVEAGVPAAQAADAARAEEPVELPAAPAAPPHAAVDALVAAAGRFDESAVGPALAAAVEELGWAGALEVVIFPALRATGREWERGRLTPAHEHFLAELIRSRIAAAVAGTPEPAAEAPTVLLACPEDERHDIGLAGLWLLLRRAGIRVCYLGADVPTEDLVTATDRLQPMAVCLAATASAALPMLGIAARAIIASRLPVQLFVGGAAIDAVSSVLEVPGVRLPPVMGDAVALVGERLGR
jgi:methanogenic corrinoid protein MtbC1